MLSSFLKERKPMLSADFPSHKDVILLDSDEESMSDSGKCSSFKYSGHFLSLKIIILLNDTFSTCFFKHLIQQIN